MNPRAFNRCMERFQRNGNHHIEQVFDIPSIKVLPTEAKLINLYLAETTQVGIVEFTLKYMEVSTLQWQRWKMMDVCDDIERLIYSYMQDTLVLKFQLNFSQFPFRAPKVKITYCSNPHYDLYKVVEQFNCDAQYDWSPALGIDLTVLTLLSRMLEEIHYV
jgi:hypothetical protein